jgi:hypothetical protein
MPVIDGTPIEGDLIAALLPEALGDATSSMPAEPKTSPLANGGTLSSAKRTYTWNEGSVTLEVIDTLHAPALRMLLERKQTEGHTSATSSWKPITLGDRPGFVQWNGTRKTAVTTLLVGGRLLVNVQLEPASSTDDAFKIAQSVPFEALEKLAASAVEEPAAAKEPEEEPEMEQAPEALADPTKQVEKP